MNGQLTQQANRIFISSGDAREGQRNVPEEVPIAFSFRGTSRGVMMATPGDLEDFAYGFCLSEGLIASARDLVSLDIVAVDGGIDLQIRLEPEAMRSVATRQRKMAGPAGCGLCGVETIADALQDLPPVTSEFSLTPAQVSDAVGQLGGRQTLNQLTRAVHAAAFFVPGKGLVAVREDVGRHNALDKLAGHLVREGVDTGRGAVVLSSRVSLELVQKTARLGAPILIAVSAPTALALRVAEGANMTVAAVARGADFEIFTHPERIVGRQRANVA